MYMVEIITVPIDRTHHNTLYLQRHTSKAHLLLKIMGSYTIHLSCKLAEKINYFTSGQTCLINIKNCLFK